MFDLKDYIKKGFKFIIIGAIGAVVNWGFLVFFVQEFRMFYLTAEILATIIAFAVNFNGNILVKNISISKNPPSKAEPPTPQVLKAEKTEEMTSNSPAAAGD